MLMQTRGRVQDFGSGGCVSGVRAQARALEILIFTEVTETDLNNINRNTAEKSSQKSSEEGWMTMRR